MRSIPTEHYEAMFLLGQAAAIDLAGSVGHIKENLTKNGATIVALKKWADRPLAFPIKKQKRGMYILCYFAAPTDKLGLIERAFNLSEIVLRHLVVKADHLNVEEMQNADGQVDLTIEANLKSAAAPAPTTGTTPAATPAVAAPAPAETAA
ncbi:MAG: 30S ribosomal protein S6 [Phycisphaerales bacterium]